MKLHELVPAEGERRARRRVARGNAGRAGTYAGRGRKGQKARSGGAKAPYFEGGQLPFVRRVPFRRGFTNIFRVQYTPIGLAELSERFDAGATVTAESLVSAGVLSRPDEPYKVLATGSLGKPLEVHAPCLSKAAVVAIEAAGGSVQVLHDKPRLAGMGRAHRRQR
jgi:large subunit ribosomal protein L15